MVVGENVLAILKAFFDVKVVCSTITLSGSLRISSASRWVSSMLTSVMNTITSKSKELEVPVTPLKNSHRIEVMVPNLVVMTDCKSLQNSSSPASPNTAKPCHPEKVIRSEGRAPASLGASVGDAVGAMVGEVEGEVVGAMVGDTDGDTDGDKVGDVVGINVGEVEGDVDGNIVGEMDGNIVGDIEGNVVGDCLLYTSPSPRDATLSRMPSSA